MRSMALSNEMSACARSWLWIFWVRVFLIVGMTTLISCSAASSRRQQLPSDDISLGLPDSSSEVWRGSNEAQGLDAAAPESLRVFWVNSYHADDAWSMQLRTGILETLARAGYSFADKTLEFEAFHIEGVYYEDLADILPMTSRAVMAMEAFAPDVVVVSDEEAIHTFIPRISDPHLPIVFCGLNGSPQGDYLNRPNVTGVLERPHLLQTLRVAQDFLSSLDSQGDVEQAVGQTSDVRESRYLIVSDGSLSGQVSAAVIHDIIYNDLTNSYIVPPADILVDNQWESWQALFARISERVAESGDPGLDFVLLLRYHTVKAEGFAQDHYTYQAPAASATSEDERYLLPQEVMRWLLENSPVPVFGLWDFAISDGAVAGLVISGYDQGAAAADIIVQIAQGVSIASIEIRSPSRSLLAMNLAAAREWGMQIPVQFAMAARVYRTLPRDSRDHSSLGSHSGLSDIRHLQGGQ
jgi:hypothetical protein